MIDNELKKFIKKEDQRLKKYYSSVKDSDKHILLRTVKISEELGELCDEVLNYTSMQRKEKLEAHDPNNLPQEFADVIITVLLLAESMKIDVEKGLREKIKKINKRYK